MHKHGSRSRRLALFLFANAVLAVAVADPTRAAVPVASVPSSATDGRATVYPLVREVSGLDGVIEDLDVSLSGVHHEYPRDLDILLVGPGGQSVMLMSDACADTPVVDRDWGWNDQAASPMSAVESCAAGGYLPTDLQPGETLPDAPAGPYSNRLSVFDDTDPNGEWALYVFDDSPNADDGSLAESFRLAIATRPAADVGFREPAVDLAEGQTRELTLTRADGGQGLAAGTVKVTSSPLTAGPGDFEPLSARVEFAAGQTEAKVRVAALADALPEEAETFALSISEPAGDAERATPATSVVTIRDGTLGPGATDSEPPAIAGLTIPARLRRGRPATIRYRLSEPAAVTLRFERVAGRRRVRVGTLRRASRAGANRVRFTGRLGGRALRRGAYRLTVTAVDAAGNSSSARRRAFRIVR
jgi:subtilisin-like proprotein convertase family protein